MAQADLLLTIAEIAVAFAGFASLVSVIGTEKTARRAVVHSLLFRTMVVMSLMVVALALVPFVTHGFGAVPEEAWRRASAVFLVSGAAGLGTGLWWLGRAKSLAGPMPGVGPMIALVDVPAGLGLLLALANSTYLTGQYAADAYVVALLLFLWGSGVCFAGLLFLQTRSLAAPPAA